MPIYDRAQSASRMLRGQSISLLGIGQPARLPDRPTIPQVSVGNVDFQGAQIAERQLQNQQQQQALGSLLQLAYLAPAAYGAYQGAQGAGGALVGNGQTYQDPYFDLNYGSGGGSPLFNLNYGAYG